MPNLTLFSLAEIHFLYHSLHLNNSSLWLLHCSQGINIIHPQATDEVKNISFYFYFYFFFTFPSFEQEGQTCVADSNCDSGLHCETCLTNGNVRPRCTRIQPISPTSKVHFYFLLFFLSFGFVCLCHLNLKVNVFE